MLLQKKPPLRALVLAGIILVILLGAVYFLTNTAVAPNPPDTNSGAITASGTTTQSGSETQSGVTTGSGSETESGSEVQSGTTSSGSTVLSDSGKLSPEEQKEVDKTMQEIDKLFEGVGN